MNDGLIPRRYAKALLKFALDNGQAERVYTLMKTLSASFAGQAELSTVMNNPFVPAQSKSSLLATAGGATKSDSVYSDFVQLLIDNNRIGMTRDIALAYLQLYRKANNIYSVEITSATAMEPDEAKRLKSLIESHVGGAKVEYHESIDPELIGGFVVTIDSERLDASLKNELKQLRLKLLSK